jgi:arylsulfatase
LHFLFSRDRGLRDGDWKVVSFRGGPWELYNLREDRTELKNLAKADPRRLQAMIDRWHEMAGDVLHATGGSVTPVQSEPIESHPEWTNFARDPVDGVRASSKGPLPRTERPRKGGISIRARKNTTVVRRGDRMQLTFTGEDPGIALDQLPAELFNGPYELSFELESESTGDGEVFFTIDAATTLPRGEHQTFPIKHDGQWHRYSIPIATEKQIRKLRLDVADGKGSARIRGLSITGAAGGVLSLMADSAPGNR